MDRGAGDPRILCVDDEPNVLAGLERVLGFDYEVTTATSGARGLAAITDAKVPFAVIVSDMRMPEMDGAAFLKRARELSPDSSRILLTGHTDLEGAVAAVNEGGIFRFLTKPTPAPLLRRTLEEAVSQSELLRSERTLLDETLRGAVGVLTDLLGLINPLAFSRAQRLGDIMRYLGEAIRADQLWELELAGRLSQVGCVVLPRELVRKVQSATPLGKEDEEIYAKHSSIAHDLLCQIPRLGGVAAMIAGQHGRDVEVSGKDAARVRRGTELLRLALDLDRALRSDSHAVAELKELSDKGYDARLVAIAKAWVEEQSRPPVLKLMAVDLTPEMTFFQDVRTRGGRMLVGQGQRATSPTISRLLLIASRGDLVEPIAVQVPSASKDAVS